MRDTITLNPDDPFESAIIDIVETNRRKRKDYAGDGNAFQNFIDSGYQTATSPGMSCETLIATKQARLRNLLSSNREPQNESVEDSILDRATYSVISLAMYREGYYSYGAPFCAVGALYFRASTKENGMAAPASDDHYPEAHEDHNYPVIGRDNRYTVAEKRL